MTDTVVAVFVKICGITTPDDAIAAIDAGADAIGLVFAPSRRQVDADGARAVVDAVGDAGLVVGVFRDHLASEVLELAALTGIGAVQLHGAETVATSERVHQAVPILFRAMDAADPQLTSIADHRADAVLLDAPVPGAGVPFDWRLVGDLIVRHRVILAGGLRPDNVAEAVSIVRPWGVDVSSGVEAGPGRKDLAAVRDFVEAARSVPVDGAPHPPFVIDRKPA